ncbi:MAG: indole-3-glycerol phosphate synthase [Crocinitomix sp.]|jgi:indole-3-glycerol phosphate synthase
MNLLEEIIQYKRTEVKQRRIAVPLNELFVKPNFERAVKSFSASIKNGNGIVAEFKRKSPSAGSFNQHSIDAVLQSYQKNKVSAISILTDEHYFGGDLSDLEKASNLDFAPVLRKDFIIDEYQIFEAKAYGADAILLIAEALDEYHATYLGTIAKSIGLEVLMEFHGASELHKMNENVDVIGINNRNLKTLKTDVRTAFDLVRKLPYDTVKIAESGISSEFEIQELLKVGFDGFLIGESLLKDQVLLQGFNKTISHFKGIEYVH